MDYQEEEARLKRHYESLTGCKQFKIAELNDYQQLAIRMAEDMTGCVLVAYEEAEASPRVLTAEELEYITALKDS